MTKAVITGITGQDGSYLAELLLQKGYEVHGIVRRASLIQRPRLDHLTGDAAVYNQRLFLHYCDLDDVTTLRRLLLSIQPSELYHLAGQSHVGLSFEIPESTCQFTAMGTLQILEIVRDLPTPPRFLNVGSSELFGNAAHSPQDEDTPFRPITPYGVAKAFAVDMVRVYRQAFGLFCVNAICYNHESPRRGESFVTRKITKAAARIASEGGPKLQLGAISATRDWGYAPEYVEAMWRMMNAETAQDLSSRWCRLSARRPRPVAPKRQPDLFMGPQHASALASSPGGLRFKPGARPWLEGLQGIRRMQPIAVK